MIEVLVSIVVLAIGVIGAAGMQMGALRTTQQTAFHTFALQLAAEIADAVRAGERQVRKNGGENPLLNLDYRSSGEPAIPGKLCYASVCDAAEFAAFEIHEWEKRIRTVLPSGRVLICRDSSPWNGSSKTLSWDCSDDAAGHAPLVIKLGWQAKNPDGSLIRDADKQFPPSVALAVGAMSE